MRIGIMLRHYDQHGGGVSVYTHNLLCELMALDTAHEFILAYQNPKWVGTYGDGNRVREVAVETPSLLLGDKLIRRRMDGFLWDQLAMRNIARREKLDVIFNPKYSLPLGTRCRTAFVCHGLDLYVMPSWARWFDRFNYYQLMPRYARKADAIIAVSNTARQHVIKYLGVEEKRVHTVYLGVSEAFRKPILQEKLEEIRHAHRLPERFFLFCGQIYPPKNFGRLIQAYARVGPELGISLVIAGKHTETRLCGDEIALIDQLGVSHWVSQLGWIEHAQLPALYALAEALLMPSLYEACPSPILEAMSSGCPVVTADRHGTAELAGQAAILVDPEDVDSIADGIRRIVIDHELRRHLVEAGSRRASEFSWEKCAQETLQVLEAVLKPVNTFAD
jgi:glycosyltransferase involved in cell wall biosynthesis